MERKVRLECKVANESFEVSRVKTYYISNGFDEDKREWVLLEQGQGMPEKWYFEKNHVTSAIFCSVEECIEKMRGEEELAKMKIKEMTGFAGSVSGSFPEMTLAQDIQRIEGKRTVPVAEWKFPRDVCAEGLIFDTCREEGKEVFNIYYSYEITCDIIEE